MVRTVLEANGYRVLEALQGDGALRLCQEHEGTIDLLLTDVVMPGGLNGFDLARRAQNARPLLKVLFISAYSVAETVLQARAESPPMLRKPFRQEQLLTQVRRALDEPADPFA